MANEIYFSDPVPGMKTHPPDLDYVPGSEGEGEQTPAPEAKARRSVEEMDDPFNELQEEPELEAPEAPEEPEEEEPAEDVEEEQIVETAPELEEEPAVTPRANARIQQLAGERTVFEQQLAAERQRSAALEAKFESLLGLLEKQAQTSSAALDRASALEKAEREAAELAAEEDRIRRLGLDPNSSEVQLWRAMQQTRRDMDARFAAIQESEQKRQQEVEQYQRQARVQLYVQQMDEALARFTKSFNVTPELRQSLREAAYAQAQAHQIPDPAEAAKVAVKLFAPALQAKRAGKPPASPEAQKAAALMSVRGATAGKKAGTNTSGRRQKETIHQIEARLSPEKFG